VLAALMRVKVVCHLFFESVMYFIVRLFSEITIKSPPVRKRWSKKLADNLRIILRRIEPKASVVLEWDRLMVRVPSEDPLIKARIIRALQSTPGIANISQVGAYPFETVHDIYELALAVWKDRLDGLTFSVRAKRNGTHDFSSLDVEKYVGGGLNQHTSAAGVKLKKPDVTVIIEIKDDTCYIVDKKYEGLGGFPVGTQESVLSLVSGGFDSTVASYLIMRRGLKTHYLFFNLGGREHEIAVKEIAFYLWNTFASSHRVKFISVPFEGVVAEILEKIGPSNMGVVLKRMMLRAAERVAARGKFEALVTGEAISQVSSQTIPNLQAIDDIDTRLVLRPLIAMDKPEIIGQARKIGTEEFSAAVPEYCGVISVKPSSKVNMKSLLAEEENFDFAVLEKALSDSIMQAIDDVPNDMHEEVQKAELVEMPIAGDVIIDIRPPNEIELKPLVVDNCSVMQIPFYALSTQFPSLDSSKRYLLYCDKGVMSQLHASHLLALEHDLVAVYRPILAV
jgi:thiamine biosynthesis protein ThiI